jgi:hypothetical protein
MNWYSQIWYLWNVLAVVPFFYFAYKRLKNQLNWDEYGTRRFPSFPMDSYIRIAMIASPSYYLLDTFTLLYLYDQFDICNLAFLIHHLITLWGSWAMLTLPYYPWFIVGTVAFHSILILFPQYLFLNYGYLMFMFCMIYGLNIKPWNQYADYRRVLHTVYALIAVPIIMLWALECPNNMENTHK